MRSYAQTCGVARALDVVGERWTLLVIRELLLGPKRFTDLEAGLPGVSSSLLGARLRELQQAGLVAQHHLPPPAASTVYQLTAQGIALEETLLALGRWGARFGRARAAADASHPDWHRFALRGLFNPEAAKGVRTTFELRFDGDVLSVDIDDGALLLEPGPAHNPDLIVSTTRSTFVDLAAGRAPVDEAVAAGTIRLEGEIAAAHRLFRIFTAEPRGLVAVPPG